MDNGRRRTSRAHVCTYQSYVFILNSTSLGWLAYLVNNLVSGVDPSHALLSLATPLHFTCVQHVSDVREHPKPPQLHPSNPELSLLQRRFIIGLYLCFHSCGHYPEIRLSWSVHTHSFLLMKPLKPPKLGTRPFSDLERPDNHGVTSSSRLLTVWASPEESWGPWPDTHSGPHHHCLHQYGDGLDAVPYCSLFSLCCAGNSCRTHTQV